MKITTALIVGILLLILLSDSYPRIALGIAGLLFLGSLISNVDNYNSLIGGLKA